MPNTATGLTTGFTTAEESIYGTPVTCDRSFEVISETLERQNQVIVSKGLRAQPVNLRRGQRRALVARSAKGVVGMEVPSVGFGRILKHAFGASTIAQQGSTTAWLQTHTLAGTVGRSMTLQKQLRDSANALVQQFTYSGCKIVSIEFSISVQNILQAMVEFDCRDEDTTTAAAALSYPAGAHVFTFAQGDLRLGGTSVAKVNDATTKLTRKLKVDGWYLGTGGLKSEPLENDFPDLTGSLSAEFDSDATFRARFAADSAIDMVLVFTGPTISGIYPELLRITVPEIHFTGETPKVSGPGVVVTKVPFEGANDGTNPGVKVEYQSTDIAY